MKKSNPLKVAFVHGRPSAHPTHIKYALAVNSTFLFEDEYLRWHDLKANKLTRYTSWIANALFFKKLRDWDIILTEGVRIPQLIQKKLRLLNKKQKLIALMSDESLYFTVSKKLPRITQFMMIQFWKSCDALICVGDFQTELAKQLLPIDQHYKIHTIFNGISKNKLEDLNLNSPKLDSKNILFIGNASSLWRTEYKGLDIMIDAIAECLKVTDLTFQIAGEIPANIQTHLLRNFPIKNKNRIQFLGKIENIKPLFKNVGLYLHLARGEAWGISINESLAAGIPTMVSDKTGSKEIVDFLSSNLIVPLEIEEIKLQILTYFSLPLAEKESLSIKCKEISNKFTEEEAIAKFKEKFELITSNHI
jgi:glycosyltransferase involved in cell wall biosynthesis